MNRTRLLAMVVVFISFALGAAILFFKANARKNALEHVMRVGGTFSFSDVGDGASGFTAETGPLTLLSSWRSVDTVDLGNTALTEEDLRLLCFAVSEIRVISIGNTLMSDQAVGSILHLKNPSMILVEGSMITSSGVASLRAAFPEATIREFHPIPEGL